MAFTASTGPMGPTVNVSGKVALLISGRAGSGKTTLANLLAAHADCKAFALADPLRAVAVDVFNALADMCGVRGARELTIPMCEDQATKERLLVDLLAVHAPQTALLTLRGHVATPRRLLQWLGTDVCRAHMGEDTWLWPTVERIAASGAPCVAITDVRFQNECTRLPAMLATHGYRTVRVHVVDPAAPPLPPTAHASEREIESLPSDVRLVNDHTRGVAAFADAALAQLRPWLCDVRADCCDEEWLRRIAREFEITSLDEYKQVQGEIFAMTHDNRVSWVAELNGKVHSLDVEMIHADRLAQRLRKLLPDTEVRVFWIT